MATGAARPVWRWPSQLLDTVGAVTSSELHLVPHGPRASSTLCDVVGTLQRDDPLTPVTVAPPSAHAGLSLRRRLAATGGLVNVSFVPLARVAELLGAQRLAEAGRFPLTGSVRRAAVRRVLLEEPGVFEEVASDQATETALDEAFAELAHLPDERLDALAGRNERTGDLVRLHRSFRRLVVDVDDESDVAAAAAEAVRDATPTLADVGAVVLHLPRSVSEAEWDLLDALAGVGRLHAVLGVTGDSHADAPVRGLAGRLATLLEGTDEVVDEHLADPDGAPPAPERVVVAPDPEEEVRIVVRGLPALREEGVPPHRTALVSRGPHPYDLLAADVLAEAGLPHHGPEARTLADSVAGRTLLGALDLRGGRLARREVVAWLRSAPVLATPRGTTAPTPRWDRCSREAGVTAGAEQWGRRLARLSERRRRRAEELRAGDETTAATAHERLADDADDLAAFVAELVEALRTPETRTWAELVRWATGLLHRYAGGEGARGAWPDHEIEAARQVEWALQGLAGLDGVDPAPRTATFVRALRRELEAPAPRTTRFGEGMFVGRVGDLVGADVEVVHVVGMGEGAFPGRAAPPSVLTDPERESTGGWLAGAAERRAEERYEYLAALCSARRRVVLAPATDPRAGRPRAPSRWFLEAAEARVGRPVYVETLPELDGEAWFERPASPLAALRSAPGFASLQERDLADLLAGEAAGTAASDHELVALVPRLRRGITALEARASASLSAHDGLVSGHLDLLADRTLSPTSLETWAECPFRYFLGHVLGVGELEEPEDVETLDERDRGRLVHEILECLVGEYVGRIAPDEPWGDDAHRRLDEIAEERFEEYEERGLTGRPVLWRLERSQILRELHQVLDEDALHRSELGVAPAATELAFTSWEGSPVDVDLDDGRTVRMRGYVDRVDAAPDGSLLRVVDYKTSAPLAPGRNDPFEKSRLHGGTRLQLPVYALAARRELGDAPVHAAYWHVRERWNFKVEGYTVDSEALDELRDVLSRIVAGVEGGVFPAVPGDDAYDWRRRRDTHEHCRWCPYDRLCTVERADAWERKRHDPAAEVLVSLGEPDEARFPAGSREAAEGSGRSAGARGSETER